MSETFIKCSCGSEAIHIETDKEVELVYISIWENGYGKNNTLSFWNRVKHCWRILTKGTPYGDQIVLNTNQCAILSYELLTAMNSLKK